MREPSGLRVCLVCGFRPTPSGGGMEKHTFELARGLLARGVEVEIICEDRSFLPDPNHELDGHVIGVDPDSLSEEGWLERYREKSRRFAALLDPDRYDLVHCHSHYGFHCALKLARQAQRPLLITTFHLTPLGSLERFAELGLPEPEGATIDRAVAVMEEAIAHLSDRCIAVSGGVAREVRDLYGVPDDRVTVVYNWFDPRTFKPTDRRLARELLGLDPDAHYLIYVGHFGLQRGRLMADVMERLPEGIVLLAVHPEPDEVIKARLGEKVWFTGYVPAEGMPLYYSAADLLCFPTVYGAFGLVLVEGMACGCPAVVFDYPAMNELVTPDCGYLVSEVSAEAFAGAVLQGLRDGQSKRPAAIQQARAFQMDPQIDKVLALYQELRGRSGRRQKSLGLILA